MAKEKKKRAVHNDPKLKIKGGSGDVIKVEMTDPPSAPVKPKEKAVKKPKKK